MAFAHKARADKTDANHFPFLRCLKHCMDELIHFFPEWNVCLIFYGVLAQARYDGAERTLPIHVAQKCVAVLGQRHAWNQTV
jgi:hypothetical protein